MEDAGQLLRAGLFVGGYAVWAVAEAIWPRRGRRFRRKDRWRTNLTMGLLGALTLKMMAVVSVPLVAVDAARWSASHRFGLLSHLDLSPAAKVALSVLVLDALVWAQHRAFHHYAWGWRFHRVHHSDGDLDVSSALRFHPVEIVLSMVLKSAVIVAVGAPLMSVLIFEVLLNAAAMFNHSNLRLPKAFEAALRLALITPDLHRVHHSIQKDEQNSNFGTTTVFWDRLVGTYRAFPREDQETMQIGLAEYQNDVPVRLGWNLRLPIGGA